MNATESSMACGSSPRDMLEQLITARAAWLSIATNVLAAHSWVAGVWLFGSMGRDDADGFSDVDLVVAVDATTPHQVLADPVAGLGLPGTVLYRRPKPCNAPRDGAYFAVGIELACLPVLVDMFVWPAATAAVSSGARIVYERERLPRSPLGFIALMDAHRSTDTRGSDPQAPGTVLMLTQLAAKYFARGDDERLAGICDQLGVSAANRDIGTLRAIVHDRVDTGDRQLKPAVEAVHRLLDVAEGYAHARTDTAARRLPRSGAANPDGRGRDR